MPIVNIQISAGRSQEEKLGIMTGVKLALKEALGLTGEESYIYINEFEVENTLIPTNEKQSMTIKILCFDGRSNQAKQLLFSRIAEHLKKWGQPEEQLVLAICDPDKYNWGIPPFA